MLVSPSGGPDGSYNPLSPAGSSVNAGVNPWRYVYPGTNNPASYDLWLQMAMGGNTNLVCNWNSRVQLNQSQYP